MAHRARPPVTRREALCRIGGGFGMMAFAGLVGRSLDAAGLNQTRKPAPAAVTPARPPAK